MTETPRYDNMDARMQAMLDKIASGARCTGDRVSPDDESILDYVGHSSSVIINDVMTLRRQLLDKLTYMANND